MEQKPLVLQVESNLKYVESNEAPTTSKLGKGEAAFGIVNGIPSLYGNSDGQSVQEYLGHLVSLRFANPIASLTDLNTLVTAGNYVCQTPEIAQSTTNRPDKVKSYFRLFVSDFANNGTVIGQLVLDFLTGKQFYRYRSAAGEWGAWTEEVLWTDLDSARSALQSDLDKYGQRISTIEGKIPAQASPDNQLSDKQYVRDTVRSNASRYIVPAPDDTERHATNSDKIWKDLASLQTATRWYYAGKAITDLTTNDYATVEVHREDIQQHEFWQALYQEVNDEGAWDMQFKLGSYLTAEQQAAMDSGVTAEWKAEVDIDRASLKTDKLDKVTSINSNLRAYTVSTTGSQTVTVATDSPDADTLALRDSHGNIKVASPVSDLDATNKTYVDSTVTGQVSTAQRSLEAALNTETERAKSVEEANATAISTETERAKKEETALTSALNQAKTDLNEAIKAEETRAKGEETALSDRIDTVVAESGTSVDLSLSATDYTLTIVLKSKTGVALTTKTVDLPLEANFNDAQYDAINKQLIFTTVDNSKVNVSIAELITGLATETGLTNEAKERDKADKALEELINSLSSSSDGSFKTKQPLLAPSIDENIVVVVRSTDPSSTVADSTRSINVDHLEDETLEDITLPSTGAVESKITASQQALHAEVEAEKARAEGAEGALQKSVSDEQERAAAAEGTIKSLVTAEATAREQGDASLQSLIEQEATDRGAAVDEVKGLVAAEESRAAEAEEGLQESIAALQEKDTLLEKADSSLQSKLLAEESSRTSADAAINERLDALSQSSEGLEKEIERAKGEEARIEGFVTAEAEARGAGDTKTLEDAKAYANSVAEAAAAQAEQAKTDAVASANSYTDTQVENAKTGLESYADSAAETAKALIDADLDSLETTLSGQIEANKEEATDAIAAEQSRAEKQEQANAASIAAETSRAQGVEEELSSAIDAVEAKVPANVNMTLDSSTYKLTIQLVDSASKTIGTAKTVDLPIESLVVGGSYDADSKQVVLELQSGKTLAFSVADLVSGLATNEVFSQAEGKNGLVPAPTTQTDKLFLREDGKWVQPTDTNTFREVNVQDDAGESLGKLASNITMPLTFKQGDNVKLSFSSATGVLTVSAVVPNLSEYIKTVDVSTIGKTGKLSDAKEDDDHKTVSSAQIASWTAKQDALTFDTAPQQDSQNPVTSGGIYTELSKKLSSVTATGGVTATLSGTSVSIKHSNSVTAGTAKEGGATRTLSPGGTFNVPTINFDAQGHIISTTYTTLTLPADKDTHYATGLYIGAAGAKSNAATSNGATYLKLYDNDTSRASFKISGENGISVSTDASGNITITGTAEGGGGTVVQSDIHLYVGNTGANTTEATENGSTYLKLYDGLSLREQYNISGQQNVLVSSDESGNILITGPDLSSYAKKDTLSNYSRTTHDHDERYLQLSGGKVNGKLGVLSLSVGTDQGPAEDGSLYILSTLTEKGKNSAYSGSGDVSVGGISWTVEGNSTINPWRFGGNTLEGVERKLTSRSPINGKVEKIIIKYGSGTITVNSVTLKIYSQDPLEESASPVYTKEVPYEAETEQTVEAGSQDWTNRYYQVVFNVTVTTSGNKYATIETIGFYASGGGQGVATVIADGIHSLEAVGNLGETDATKNYLLTKSSLAFWDGRYDDSNSNLKFFSGGEIAGKTDLAGMVTADGTLTSYAVVVGAGTSKVTVIGTGASGQVLTSNGSTGAPSWKDAPSGGISYTPGTGISISSSNQISTNAATITASGHVTTVAQTFAGRKTFNDGINIPSGATIQLNGSSGTAGQVLTSNGANSAPSWKDPPSGGGTADGNTSHYHEAGVGLSVEGNAGTTEGTVTYSLKSASSDEIGGVLLGYTQSGKTYPLELDAQGRAYVTVPWEPGTGADGNTAHSHTAGDGLSVEGGGGISGSVKYSLKTAASGSIGGVSLGFTKNDSARQYPLELDTNGKAFVTVPWTNTDTDTKVTIDDWR